MYIRDKKTEFGKDNLVRCFVLASGSQVMQFCPAARMLHGNSPANEIHAVLARNITSYRLPAS